jgi:PAS domain S-box-containing protein
LNFSYDAFVEAVHPDDREAVKAAYWGSIHEGRDTYEIEHRLIRGDTGEVRFVLEKCEHVRDGAGSVIRSTGMVQDITESKRTEASLRETKERMSQALRAANAGAWEWRMQTNEAIWSDENYLVLGLEPGSVKSCYESWTRVVHPEDRAEADRLVTEAIRNRSDLDISFRVVWPDGSVHWINDRGKLVFDGRGEPLGMYGIQIDITERQRAQEALQKKEEYYRSLLDNAMDIVTILGPDGIILYESPSVKKIVGYRPEELVGRDVFALMHPDDAGPMREVFERLLRAPGAMETAEFRFQHREGSWRILEAIGKNLLQVPAVEAIVINLRDVTDRRNAEEQLRVSLQQKDTLLREIHHRVKNNLQVIASLLHLQSRAIKNPQALEALRESQQRVKAMAMIHERLYQTEDVSCIVLKDYIEDLVHGIVQANAQDQPVAVQFDIPAILLSIHAAVPCGLIINELVSNCMKHAFPKGQKGRILIGIRASEEKRLTLLVEDDGRGLPEEVDIDNGGALGLTLVRVLVKQLEGTIEIRRGAGTRFRITFSDNS